MYVLIYVCGVLGATIEDERQRSKGKFGTNLIYPVLVGVTYFLMFVIREI